MDRIERFLQQRADQGLLRALKPVDSRGAGKLRRDERELIDFSSNDYLGLANHPAVKRALQEAAGKFGASSCASRLLSGDMSIHHTLEAKVAALSGKEGALVFSSGYQANVGIISALVGRGDAVFSDKLNHASIVDGIGLSGAKCFRFRHNDLDHLETLLKKHDREFESRLIVTETVFSMEGDRPPLDKIADLKDKYDGWLMVDEAHATGIYGPHGAGLVAQEELAQRVELIMGTFSKALGGFGAYVAGSRRVIDFLVNACRSFIYSTALPPVIAAANLAALETVEKEPWRGTVLRENAAWFREQLIARGYDVRGSSQIVSLVVGEAQRAGAASKALEAQGFWVLPIRPPTVPAGESRLRFSLTCEHSRQQLSELIEHIDKVLHASVCQ
ncbi:MAG: 8-amino-7-oxononanoate synthase [Phycisphaerales bacterium]|nr:MAG: 8-amino-7-oxononanoate synthase [Phycisphaerales bacterium]